MEIKDIKSKSLKGYIYAKLKKHDAEVIARAVQKTLQLPVTREFDERTVNAINNVKTFQHELFKEKMSRYLA